MRLAVPERTNDVAGQYAAAAEALAEELGVPCLNLWRAFQVGTRILRRRWLIARGVAQL